MVIIQDIADVTVRHMKTFSPTTGKKAMTIFQEAYPANPKAMYFLGMPSFMTSIFNVMMSFSKEKFKQRIQLVGKDDFAKLHEELGIEILPKEYGGTNGSVQDHLGIFLFFSLDMRVTKNQMLNSKCQRKFLVVISIQKDDSLTYSRFELK